MDINHREDKYEIVLGVKELASKGLAAEVVDEVNALDPNFFMQNPILLFQLKQVLDFSVAHKIFCFHSILVDTNPFIVFALLNVG